MAQAGKRGYLLLNEYAGRGLRLIEVDKQELIDLPAIVEPLYERPERFMLFCDDLSFTADDSSYKALKAVLDGSISSRVGKLVCPRGLSGYKLWPKR